ncbi:stage III sporulation protein AD [Desulfitibacter alkalitolerans]|uniref:stage III sporulation protein AD n=1 Tax=Desulfitibacter alkalitolerans TaxID=264641 RepID=UPI0004814FFE|nr:stage III sporulation protein AD [Desulfitibacter alkalitolerans]
MEILQIVGLGILAAIIIVLVKQANFPTAAIILSILVGATIFLMMLTKIGAIIDILQQLADRANVNQFYLATILKIIGIAYIAEFGSQMCRDSGESAIASKIEFAAKILIMILAIPIFAAILESIIRLLP